MTATSDQGSPTLDVTPRTAAAPRRRRGLLASLVLLGVVVALVLIAVNALGDASLFFLNADEAVERRDELGGDRFRLQGTVERGTVAETADGVTFTVAYRGVEVDVTHRGDPPELFQPGIPVVLEGAWAGEGFASDRILVRHTSEYEAENEDRLREADEGGSQPPAGASDDAP